MSRKIFPNKDELSKQLVRFIEKEANEKVIRKNGDEFRIALSGGSLVGMLEQGGFFALDQKKWKIFLTDERAVPSNHPDCTWAQYDTLYEKHGLQNVDFKQPYTDHLSLEENALRYSGLFPHNDGNLFDLVILGMGPDGHTASLFPGSTEAAVDFWSEQSLCIPVYDSPKPPPSRISLSLTAISRSKRIEMVATGGSKAPTIKKILAGEFSTSPVACLLERCDEKFRWWIDKEAAANEEE